MIIRRLREKKLQQQIAKVLNINNRIKNPVQKFSNFNKELLYVKRAILHKKKKRNLPCCTIISQWCSYSSRRSNSTANIHLDCPSWAQSIPVCIDRRNPQRRSPYTDNRPRNRGMAESRGNRRDTACNRETVDNRRHTDRTCILNIRACIHRHLLPKSSAFRPID